MRLLHGTAISCLVAFGVPCQKGGKPDPKQDLAKRPPQILVTYDVRNPGRRSVERFLPWMRDFVGKRGSVGFVGKQAYLLVKADRAAQKRVADLLDWAGGRFPVEFEATITELRGAAENLQGLLAARGSVLKDQAAVTKLLRAAQKLEGVKLRNHPPRQMLDQSQVVLRKKRPPDGKENKTKGPKKSIAPAMRIGATLLEGGVFLAKTWHPEVPIQKLQVGHTLVVRDPQRGRILLIRYDRVTAKRRPDQLVEILPIRRG